MVEIIEGNLLESECTFICHQVNCKKAMGRGIAGQIRQKWPKVYEDYCYNIDYMYENDFATKSSDLLGMITWTELEDSKYMMNFFSQDEYYPRNVCHTDYNAFTKCCRALKKFIEEYKLNKDDITIGFPYKIGCGLAGGDWNIVYNIIEDEFKDEYNVKIYKLKEEEN